MSVCGFKLLSFEVICYIAITTIPWRQKSIGALEFNLSWIRTLLVNLPWTNSWASLSLLNFSWSWCWSKNDVDHTPTCPRGRSYLTVLCALVGWHAVRGILGLVSARQGLQPGVRPSHFARTAHTATAMLRLKVCLRPQEFLAVSQPGTFTWEAAERIRFTCMIWSHILVFVKPSLISFQYWVCGSVLAFICLMTPIYLINVHLYY